MIQSVEIEGFKSLRRLTLSPGRFTVLVGPNGAGKTSILQALQLVSQIALSRPNEARKHERADGPPSSKQGPLALLADGPWEVERILSRGANSLGVRVTTPRGELHVKAKPPVEGQHGSIAQVILNSSRVFPAGDGQPLWGDWEGKPASWGDETDRMESIPPLRRFGNAFYLHPDLGQLIEPSSTETESPQLASDGRGLASVLDYLAGAEPEAKAAIEADLRLVVPQVRGIRTSPARIQITRRRPFAVGNQSVEVPVEETVWGHRFSLEMAGGTRVPADQLSEGTVIALCLLTLLHGPAAPSLVLIDDLDRALHLGAQVRLVRILRGLLEKRPELQIICTSHSPFLLQEVKPEEVVVVAPDAEGWTHARSLDQHPEFDRWRAALDTGELWANLGEDWVLA
jgi:energy-coupling factor transporter ATP-binding protein EcfA2